MKTQTNPKLELLKRFCQKPGGYRAELQKPIRRDGFLYATTGWIAIRVEDDPSIKAGNGGTALPNIHTAFDHGEIEFHPLPMLPEAIKCKHCNGKGIEYLKECPDCDGEGDFVHGNHTYQCKECDCAGTVKSDEKTTKPTGCWHCGGTGEADYSGGAIPTQVGGLHFQNYLLRMIVNLPNAHIEHVYPSDEKSLPGTHFIFDGGEGVVMPFKV